VTRNPTLDASLRAAVQVGCAEFCHRLLTFCVRRGLWPAIFRRIIYSVLRLTSVCTAQSEWKNMRRAFADADKGHRSVLGHEEFAAVSAVSPWAGLREPE
jgi:hypothetical protein